MSERLSLLWIFFTYIKKAPDTESLYITIMDLTHGLSRPPGVGNGNALQCSCRDSPMERGAGGTATACEVSSAGRD